jgi:hypothetical protein
MPVGGIPVLSYAEFGNSVVRTPYVVRLPPRANDGIYTPASRTRSFRVSSELRPPRYRIDLRRQLLNLRGNDIIHRGSAGPGNLLPVPVPSLLSHELSNMVLSESWYNPENSRVVLSTAGVTGGLTVWNAANIRRPASAKQVLLAPAADPPPPPVPPAPPEEMPDAQSDYTHDPYPQS